jgi:hypothetical protein
MKKSLSIILALIMIMSTVSIGVFAADELTQSDYQASSDQITEEGDAQTTDGAPAVLGEGQQDTNGEDLNRAVGEQADENVQAGDTAQDTTVPTDGEIKDAWEGVEVTAEPKGTTGATVKWNQGVEGAQAYQVEAFKDNGEEAYKTVKADSDATAANITGLNDAGTYTFKLHAYSDENCTEESEIVPSHEASGEVVISGGEKPDKPKNLKTYSAYKSIALEWTANKNATGYYVYRSTKKSSGYKKIADVKNTDENKAYDSDKKLAFIDDNDGKGLNDGPSHKVYYYKVAAYNDGGTSDKTDAVKDSCVAQMYIKGTFKQTVQLTSHDGKNKKHTFKAGETIYATGYEMGKYHFYHEINGKEYLFYAMYMRLGNIKADYTKSFNYSKKEAEYFCNTTGKYGNSDKKYLVWANLYTQHVYVMKGSKGKWRVNKTLKADDGKVYSNWECSSGTAHTPSPWGMGLKFHGKLVNIYNRQWNFPGHGAMIWNFYHSETALHGPVNSNFGVPQSHGCIRNPKKYATFLFKKVPLKSRVIVF